MNPRALMHDDDLLVYFDATQEARHAALLRVNEMAKAMVERIRARVASQVPDEDGVLPGPSRLRIVLGEDHEDKTVKQRNFLHKAVFPQIADQAMFADGSRFEWRVWKEMFRSRFLGFRWEMNAEPRWDEKRSCFVTPKRKTPHKVRVSTEDLSIKQYSEYIDLVIDTAVLEYGVVFRFIAEERDAVRYVRPVRAKKGQEVQA